MKEEAVRELVRLTDEQLADEIVRAKNTLDRGSIGSRKGIRQGHRWLERLEKEQSIRAALRRVEDTQK